MIREDFIKDMDTQLKLVRTEYNFTQDVMARILGISKKTLVEIEKGRVSLGWSGAVTLCSIFSDSQVLSGKLGGEAGDMIKAIAFQDLKPNYPKTMGGKVWWRVVEKIGEYTVQQNIISQHYRILDAEDRRVYSSFDLNEIKNRLKELGVEYEE